REAPDRALQHGESAQARDHGQAAGHQQTSHRSGYENHLGAGAVPARAGTYRHRTRADAAAAVVESTRGRHRRHSADQMRSRHLGWHEIPYAGTDHSRHDGMAKEPPAGRPGNEIRLETAARSGTAQAAARRLAPPAHRIDAPSSAGVAPSRKRVNSSRPTP